ncbi:MAG TPA: vanadium-dependent haloperoxidase [Candidatus Limnocylindrales bacterium]|nr:vanadium-dependent haloperoxidase [Candidatus Limnocylindrales bacterium]
MSRHLLPRHALRRARLSRPVAAILIAASLVIPSVSASAAEPTDMVLEWNANAIVTIQSANGASPPGLNQVPPAAGLQLAIVQLAVYDAVNAIDRTHQPYLPGLTAPAGASQAAAAATAAHHVLIGLTPSSLPLVIDSVDAMYAASLAKIPAGQARTGGIAVGAAAAAAILANRAGDGRFGSRTFPVGTEPGEWRPVPPLNANAFSWVGDVRPFSLGSSDQLRIEAPPALDSAQYAAEFNEVKAVGAQTGSTRTPDQNALASFIVQNPFSFVYRAFRELSVERGLSTAQQARLFALLATSSADAFIACWNNKNEYLFWRPQTAIRLADTDGNPATTADPTWSSLFPTPGYPDWPSGYNCFAGSMMRTGRTFFGTDFVHFELKSPAGNRSYDRFSDYVRDAINGRILIGFHFRSADVTGAWIGKKAAQWVARHEFGPVD